MNLECKDKEIRALRSQLLEKNMLFSLDDEVLKPDQINKLPFNELKISEHPIELLNYPLESEVFNEINKHNNDVQTLEDLTRTENKTNVNDNLKDFKISENPEMESIDSENDFNDEDCPPEKPADQDFLVYKNNLLNDPDHVIRYCFNSKTVPMFYSSQDKFKIDDIPDCEHCGSKRVFEFQVNNTLLNSVDQLCDMDWGVIAVYSCSNTCFSDSQHYIKEVVRIQREIYETRDFKVDPKYEEEEESTETKPAKTKKPKKKKAKKPNTDEFNANSWA